MWRDVDARAIVFWHQVREQVSVRIISSPKNTKIGLVFEVIGVAILAHIVSNNQGRGPIDKVEGG